MEPQLCPETARILLSKSVPADNSNKLALKQELNKVTVSREVSGAPVKGVTERRPAMKRSRNGSQEEVPELVRAKASDREPLEAQRCSYSIQEVLKVYNFNLQSKNPEDFTFRVWRQLPDSTQEKLSPLLSSLYKHQPGPRPALPSPLYLSEQGRTYKDWLLNLSLVLISLISDQKTNRLFEVCLPALKKDLTIGDLLLPRIVIAVLCECKPENNRRLLVEIRAM